MEIRNEINQILRDWKYEARNYQTATNFETRTNI